MSYFSLNSPIKQLTFEEKSNIIHGQEHSTSDTESRVIDGCYENPKVENVQIAKSTEHETKSSLKRA